MAFDSFEAAEEWGKRDTVGAFYLSIFAATGAHLGSFKRAVDGTWLEAGWSDGR